jgi:hypothetical protein
MARHVDRERIRRAKLIGSEAAVARAEAARRKLADCDGRLAKYRNALEAGADAAIVGPSLACSKVRVGGGT